MRETFTLDDVNWGASSSNSNIREAVNSAGVQRERFGLEDIPGYSYNTNRRSNPRSNDDTMTRDVPLSRERFGLEDVPGCNSRAKNSRQNISRDYDHLDEKHDNERFRLNNSGNSQAPSPPQPIPPHQLQYGREYYYPARGGNNDEEVPHNEDIQYNEYYSTYRGDEHEDERYFQEEEAANAGYEDEADDQHSNHDIPHDAISDEEAEQSRVYFQSMLEESQRQHEADYYSTVQQYIVESQLEDPDYPLNDEYEDERYFQEDEAAYLEDEHKTEDYHLDDLYDHQHHLTDDEELEQRRVYFQSFIQGDTNPFFHASRQPRVVTEISAEQVQSQVPLEVEYAASRARLHKAKILARQSGDNSGFSGPSRTLRYNEVTDKEEGHKARKLEPMGLSRQETLGLEEEVPVRPTPVTPETVMETSNLPPSMITAQDDTPIFTETTRTSFEVEMTDISIASEAPAVSKSIKTSIIQSAAFVTISEQVTDIHLDSQSNSSNSINPCGTEVPDNMSWKRDILFEPSLPLQLALQLGGTINDVLLEFDPSDPVAEKEGDTVEKATLQSVIGQFIADPERTVKTRPYQQEMFELSLQSNIIICQPTGSGKTHVAILRIRHELEHSPPNEITWFLAPNRILCEQQFRVLQRDLPPVQMKLLSGSDGVEKWNAKIWDEILNISKTRGEERVRVVVSTHQILLDALSHGFVTLDNLCLIIFDEAHHCIYSHPANKIMQDFYHPALSKNEKVPAILGLTASPLFNGGVDDLNMVEQNLNAICRTPTANRESLQTHARLPTLKPVGYGSKFTQSIPSASFSSLQKAYHSMDIHSDPYIQSLPRETAADERVYQRAVWSGNTDSRKFVKILCNKADHLIQEYGSWPADFFIHTLVSKYVNAATEREDEFVGYMDEEKLYIRKILSKVTIFEMTDEQLLLPGALTPKMIKLIDILLEEYGKGNGVVSNTFSGLVFVEQRVAVSVVAEVLSRHARTKDIFHCGGVLGASMGQGKKDLVDLINPKHTTSVLDDFRSGQKNLLIATSVAEEGLDVQACNLVISTYMPKTNKSYVQMRGRARRVNSTYVLMYEDADVGRLALERLNKWEASMIEAYEDQSRELVLPDKEDYEAKYDHYRIASTGALLTYESAIPHLHHFCAVIPHSVSTDIRPEFTSYRLDDGMGQWTAEITLPSCIPPALRKHYATNNWNKQRTAEQDVAFNTYIALHEAGLVDDNLMPLPTTDPDLKMEEIAKKSSDTTVPLQLDPWTTPWSISDDGEYEVYITELRIQWSEDDILELPMLLPFPCPSIASFDLWWTNTQPVHISIQDARTPTFIPLELFSVAQHTTYTLFTSIYGFRMENDRKDFPYLFTPTENISAERVPADEALRDWAAYKDDLGIVRDLSQNKKPYLFKAWNYEATISPEEMEKRWSKHELIPDMPLLEVTPIPKRRNFAHRSFDDTETINDEDERERVHDTRTSILLPQACTIDRLPWRLSRAALLIPCILRRIEIYAIAQTLQKTVLASVDLRDIEGIVTAITATSAREFTHYQKYEILGDSVLKFLAGLQLLADYPLWHEGYLSGKKDRSVANSKLAAESVRLGMSRFIITNLFTATKWRPKYSTPLAPHGNSSDIEAGASVSEGSDDVKDGAANVNVQAVAVENEITEQRKLSTKILADVVESLMGAAYLEGGFDKAMQVAQVFGLGMKWDTLENRLSTLYQRAPELEDFVFPKHLEHLETMIGYTFRKKSFLLEAITHPGYNIDSLVVSYQRMEFLGDSVLDMALVEKLFHYPRNLDHVDIHLYKSASVNADFLAFLCLKMSLVTKAAQANAQLDPKTGLVTVISTDIEIPFYKFLRHSTREVAQAQASAYTNYLALNTEISDEFSNSDSYPWTKLSALNAEKFLSDMVESIIGAVFIDSGGSFAVVNKVLEKFLILPILDRLLDQRADPRHPITKVGVHAAKSLSRTKYVAGAERGGYTCEVYVDEVLMARAGEGLSRKEVKTRAAELAYLEMMKREAEGEGKGESSKKEKRRKRKGKERMVEQDEAEDGVGHGKGEGDVEILVEGNGKRRKGRRVTVGEGGESVGRGKSSGEVPMVEELESRMRALSL